MTDVPTETAPTDSEMFSKIDLSDSTQVRHTMDSAVIEVGFGPCPDALHVDLVRHQYTCVYPVCCHTAHLCEIYHEIVAISCAHIDLS